MDFRILGPLEVVDGARQIDLGGPKQRAVLAHLLISANQVVSAERLIDEIWGDEAPESATASVQSYVSRLRRALGGAARIEWRWTGYALVVDPTAMDAVRFENSLRDGRRLLPIDPEAASARLAQALELWRGTPLADVPGATAAAEAARLEELRLAAVEQRVATELAIGKDADVIADLEAILRENPLRERLWAQLMLALYRCGRQAHALDAFHRARHLFDEELGLDPSPELEQLQIRILRHDPELARRELPLRGYRLLERIGEGMFGVVHRAIQPHVGREVALKAIHPRLAHHPTFIRRFELEAQLVARLEHPRIVPLYDYWRDASGAFLVMRWLRGGSLASRLADGPYEPAAAAVLIEQVGAGLEIAHHNGVVHRDLKPGNILLDEQGDAYLSDFGIATELAALAQPTADDRASSPYLSPEELRGEPVSPRTDIYALGAIARELLTGQGHPPPAARRPDLPPGVSAVVDRAMALDPGDRFADTEAFVNAFRSAILGKRAAPPPILLAAAPGLNPYKGLHAFQEADAADFFGRETLTRRLIDRLTETSAGSRFLAIVGPSGSGKSSVVRAGLLPAIRQDAVPGSRGWFVAELFPGPDPLGALEEALLRIAFDPPVRLSAMLARERRGLLEAVNAVLPDDGSELLLLIDQFEELFTLVPDERTRGRLLEMVEAAVTDADSRVRVVITLRADFYDRPLEYPAMAQLLQERTEVVPPLAADEVESAVTRPAERVGLLVEPAVAAELIRSVLDQPRSLPLLQYAVTQLFERRSHDRLTLDALRALGGMAGVIARQADELCEALAVMAKDAARQVFLRLVAVSESGEETRRRVLLSELTGLETDAGAVEAVIDAFGQARLLSFDRDPASRAPTVEVAHEALIREWTRLRGWIEAARQDLFTHRRLAAAASEWQAVGREASYLARGANLDQMESWAGGTGLVLTTRERDFLSASVAERASQAATDEARRRNEAALERRAVRRLRGLVAVLGIGVLTAVGLAAYAFAEGGRAEREARFATARELAAASLSILEVDPELSILLALEATGHTQAPDELVLREAEEALHAAVQATRLVDRLPIGAGEVISSSGRYIGVASAEALSLRDAANGEELALLAATDVARLAVSPDGRFAATGGIQGPPTLWAARTGELLVDLPGESGFLDALEFSPDGGQLAAMTVDGAVRVWEVPSGRERMSAPSGGGIGLAWSPDGSRLAVAAGSETHVYAPPTVIPLLVLPGDGRSVAFSADGSRLLTTGEDTANLWDASSGDHLQALSGHSGIVNAAAFSADGRLAATGGHDGSARVWDVESGASVLVLTGQAGSVDRLWFGADGSRLHSHGATGSLAWDISRSGSREVLTFADHDGRVANVTYSADGRRIATAGFDGRAVIWDAGTGERLHELVGHDAGLLDIVFSADSKLIATASLDGTVRLWDASGTHLRTLEGHAAPVWAVSFSPDSARLVTSSEDFTARIWDVASARQLHVLAGHDDYVWDAAWSPEGSVVVTVGNDFAGRVWDADSGQPLATLGHDENVVEQAFSPDGTRVGTASFDATAKVWEVETGELRLVLSGHGGIVLDVEASPDGSRWATASLDGFVRLWDATSGEELLKLSGPVAMGRLAFSPDGRHLAAAADDGTVRIFALHVEELMELARARLTRSLTDVECRQYLHLEACPNAGGHR